jgi:epoxyqueuosine reductase
LASTKQHQTLTRWRETVRGQAHDLGFALVGFTTAEPLDRATQRKWSRWLAADRAGEMNYLRRTEPRRTHPRDLLPEAQSVIVVAASYYQGDHGESEEQAGKIARYAWGRDYHQVLRGRLERLAAAIESGAMRFGFEEPIRWRAFSDSAPLDERNLARRAGLGFIGKNTLLLHPKHGSWFLLAELLTSVPFPPDDPAVGSCGRCRKCIDACPTEALLEPYDLDPRRCISYLTIEQKGEIAPEFEREMNGWAFGCDICQEVCPFNEAPLATMIREFDPSEGFGKHLDEEELSEIGSNKSLQKKYAHTPLTRPGLKGLRRNLRSALASIKKSNPR